MSRWRAGIPAELERIVFKCLEKRPAHRYPDAAELKAELIVSSAPGRPPDSKPGLSPLLKRAVEPCPPRAPEHADRVCQSSPGGGWPSLRPVSWW